MIRHGFITLILIGTLVSSAAAQDLSTVREDQINRLKDYVVAAIQPSGLVRDSVVLNGTSFHPATPDAAGFALLGLSALHHLGKLPDAEQRVVNVLSAYAGQTPGVAPRRSADGHFVHFMNLEMSQDEIGAPAPGWKVDYTPIGTALLVAGAQFARNHFPGNAAIASLTDQLTDRVNFNNAIHPSLNGGIYHDMTAAGGGSEIEGTAGSWNEYMLVESLALRETDNSRALAVKHRWHDTDFIAKKSYAGIPTLTDNPSEFASGFWVQQMHFFNGDFRHSADFETFFSNQQEADKLYSANALGQAFRYGLTAGLVPEPVVYHADRIWDQIGDPIEGPMEDHPFNVFSPEAVAAWGDMNALLQFYAAQVLPSNDPRYKYGMVRVSGTQPAWIPADAGLVDHLFLLFGLVESLHPDFFADRVFPALEPGDYNADGSVDAADYHYWRQTFGSQAKLAADGNSNGVIDAADYIVWRRAMGDSGNIGVTVAPEPTASGLIAVMLLFLPSVQRRKNSRRDESACNA